MNFFYYLVSLKGKPIAIVRRSETNTIKLICGRIVALRYFKDGIPDDSGDMPVNFWIVAMEPTDPAIGYWIDRLEVQQTRKRHRSLSRSDKDKVQELKAKGHKTKVIAERFDVSVSTIKRILKE